MTELAARGHQSSANPEKYLFSFPYSSESSRTFAEPSAAGAEEENEAGVKEDGGESGSSATPALCEGLVTAYYLKERTREREKMRTEGFQSPNHCLTK